MVVVERAPLPAGASTRNAGFACFGSMTELIDDLMQQPSDEVWQLVEMRWRGLRQLRNRLGDRTIGYEAHGGLELFAPDDELVYQACLDRREEFNHHLQDIVGIEEAFLPTPQLISHFGLGQTQHLMLNQAEGQLHTGKLMRALLALAREVGVEIFNGLPLARLVPESDQVQVETAQGWTFAVRHALVATNGFASQLLPHLAIQPARNQVLLTEPIPQLKLRGAFHYDRGYVYFRDIDGRVLLGGARNVAAEAESTDQWGESDAVQARLKAILREVIVPRREVAIEQRWSGILGVGPSKAPIVEAIRPNLVVAIRLGGMGVAIGGEVGRRGADLLLGQK